MTLNEIYIRQKVEIDTEPEVDSQVIRKITKNIDTNTFSAVFIFQGFKTEEGARLWLKTTLP